MPQSVKLTVEYFDYKCIKKQQKKVSKNFSKNDKMIILKVSIKYQPQS